MTAQNFDHGQEPKATKITLPRLPWDTEAPKASSWQRPQPVAQQGRHEVGRVGIRVQRDTPVAHEIDEAELAARWKKLCIMEGHFPKSPENATPAMCRGAVEVRNRQGAATNIRLLAAMQDCEVVAIQLAALASVPYGTMKNALQRLLNAKRIEVIGFDKGARIFAITEEGRAYLAEHGHSATEQAAKAPQASFATRRLPGAVMASSGENLGVGV